MSSNDPRKIKALGRKIANFDETIWCRHKYNIVVKGNFAKFSQNDKLKKKLLSTGNKIICEASPYDKIWGIGLSTSQTDVHDPSKCQGQNLLGRALMDVRTTLKSQ